MILCTSSTRIWARLNKNSVIIIVVCIVGDCRLLKKLFVVLIAVIVVIVARARCRCGGLVVPRLPVSRRCCR